MNKEGILDIISNANDDSIYLADIETYDLIYLSPAALQLTDRTPDDYVGEKCYQALQGLDAPCPFCTNQFLTEHDFYIWEHNNTKLGRHFILRDRLVRYLGKLVRMEIATDITERKRGSPNLMRLQAIDESLVRCIDTLKNSDDTALAMNSFLSHIGAFYQADQVHIFEMDANTQMMQQTYQWISENCPIRQEPSAHARSVIDRWFHAFDKNGFIRIVSVKNELAPDSAEYAALSSNGVDSLIAVPLLSKDGAPIGVIRVDNPKINLDAPRLLRSVSNFVVDGISKRAMLDKLDKLSYNDTLTGLFNRNRYTEQIREFQKKPPATLGIIYLDIDGLKRANDTYGHAFGDALLTRTADLLVKGCPYDVYRIGGDEFVVLCPEIAQEDFQFLTERLRKAFKKEGDLSVSIGTKWTTGAIDAMEQVVDANHLMDMEKQSYYNSMRASRELHYVQLKEKLLKDIRQGVFSVYMQPQFSLSTQQVVGAEALVRKTGLNGEMIPPAMFIPFYENEGLIPFIDFFVLKTVCQAVRDWNLSSVAVPPISINFSRITLMTDDFTENIVDICNHYEVPYHIIDIEMTETISKMDLQVLAALVKRLRGIGFSVSLDDFGTRYSNLSILTAIEFDHIKIDKSLVDHIATNEKAHIIVDYTIRMGKAFKQAGTVAEGIEKNDQLDALTNLNCDIGQGYYFSKPISMREFFSRYLMPKA